MKIPKLIPKDKRRQRVRRELRRLAKRRDNQLGSGLIDIAVEQMEDGDNTKALATLEHFEVVAAGNLLPSDVATLQRAKQTLGASKTSKIATLLGNVVIGLVLKALIQKAWTFIITLIQISITSFCGRRHHPFGSRQYTRPLPGRITEAVQGCSPAIPVQT